MSGLSQVGRLKVVLALNLSLVVGLVVVGLSAHSLGVLAEGADYLADAAAIGVSVYAIRLAQRPPTPDHPDGYPQATNLAALVNAAWLLVLSVLVAASALDRLATGSRRVDGLPVLVVSGVAAVAMVAGALVLGGDGDDGLGDDLNLRAVILDTAADALAAAGVAASGAVILVTGRFYWLDPGVALAISVVVAYHAARLLRSVIRALVDGRSPA